MDLLPLFKSHYSIGRSILTLSKPDDKVDGGPDSIIDICTQNKLKEFYLIEDSMSGFLEAYVNSKENDLKLIFGLRVTVCPDLHEKNKESATTGSAKYIILCKNTEGYKRLIKISSLAAKEGFYYHPRIDFEHLKKYWSNKDLKLCVPFYDSFLHHNYFGGDNCHTNFTFTDPDFFVENNDLPFDHLLLKRVKQFTEDGKKYPLVKTQSIYYKDKSDFKSYLTFRAINNRTTLGKPNLDHMGSNTFCFEKWKNKSLK